MDIWVEGSDRGEADQRPAPMTIPFINALGMVLVDIKYVFLLILYLYVTNLL